ncbi:GNAT family N-acetyltransferase [Rummeliibacillus pycnus]|uniref:GNAT family N-acetyltransferase n=1 Tax=Rummeliibacillus pycnus TaxID=101070 RepID=UPI000C9CDB86|nr:GNAT family N-acetyltransferase [Rummeliibacillus pycnus]
MDVFLMKASYPLDELTIQELKALIQQSNTNENQDIALLLNADSWSNYESQGFVVLAYSEEDQLLGALSAIDLFGLNTYEWSTVVHPNYRRQGIGTALVQEFTTALVERGAAGDMGLSFHDVAGHQFLKQIGYEYNSSEATLQATAKPYEPAKEIYIRPFKEQDRDILVQLMQDGFGDMPEETDELISFNTTTLGRTLYIVEFKQKIVATVSIVENEAGLWVTALTVQQALRNQGIGSAILRWAKNEAHKKQQHKVLLDVEIDNINALSVYQKEGFTPLHQVDYFIKS